MAKSFKDRIQEKASNPTMQFISTPETDTQDTSTAEPPRMVSQRAIPQYEEAKSRRLQLLLTPSLYEAVKSRASEERLSVNALINSILRETLEK